MRNFVAFLVVAGVVLTPHVIVYKFFESESRKKPLGLTNLIVGVALGAVSVLLFYELGNLIGSITIGKERSPNGHVLIFPVILTSLIFYSRFKNARVNQFGRSTNKQSRLKDALLWLNLAVHGLPILGLLFDGIRLFTGSPGQSSFAAAGFLPLILVAIAVSYFFWRLVIKAILK